MRSRKGVLWKLLVHIVVDAAFLILVLIIVFSLYRSCTTREVTQQEMDIRRIAQDMKNLADGESMFVPVIMSEYKIVLYPSKDAQKPACGKGPCLCAYKQGEEDVCVELDFADEVCAKSVCVTQFQRIDIGMERWVIVKRHANILSMEKSVVQ